MEIAQDSELGRPSRTRRTSILPAAEWMVIAAFFLSGIAALTYQVTWQRLLYAEFGVDLESITIIVSCFMLGLGLGSLLGGWLADYFHQHKLRVFGLVELSIGLFGLASPGIIPAVGESFAHTGPVMLAVASFTILLLPTLLMGATLPLLIAHFYSRYQSVGVSVGNLYFVNTLGAAAGAYGTGLFGFNHLTLDETIRMAAAINFVVATAALLASAKSRP